MDLTRGRKEKERGRKGTVTESGKIERELMRKEENEENYETVLHLITTLQY